MVGRREGRESSHGEEERGANMVGRRRGANMVGRREYRGQVPLVLMSQRISTPFLPHVATRLASVGQQLTSYTASGWPSSVMGREVNERSHIFTVPSHEQLAWNSIQLLWSRNDSEQFLSHTHFVNSN